MDITGGGGKKEKRDVGSLFYTDLIPWTTQGNEETREFILQVVDILIEYLKRQNDRSTKVLDFHHPQQLKDALDLHLPEKPLNLDQLLTDCKDTLKYQVRTGHPHFFNQLSSGIDSISMLGEWLTATCNTNMFTYEIAPVFILMEEVVTTKMREIIGWPTGEGDSILAPGGSVSNLYAVMAARHAMFPDAKFKGNNIVPQLTLYTSDQSHYSIKGAAATMGIGTDNVYEVQSDELGRMIPAELERCIQETLDKGHTPFFVAVTSGTTVLGAFDPINTIADICDKYSLWLHVDGAWGGGVLLSRKQRYRVAGIERAKSVTWNPHKLMGALLQCSTIHFRQDGLLLQCNQMSADYLFQQDKHYDVHYDTGDKVMQCGRHNDIFKLWLMWRAKGDEGFEKQIDHLFELTDYMVQEIKKRGNHFHLLMEPECTNVCFWYIPPSMRHIPDGPDKRQKLGDLCPKIKERMMVQGTLMVGFQPQGDLPNFFRTIISNQALTKQDIDYHLDEIERLGKDL